MSTPPSKPTPARRDIFTEYVATNHERMIVRYPDDDDGRLGRCFAEAADRLADTHEGRAHDDALLMPFLYLYRHAIELDLKHSIRFAVRLRRNNAEDDPRLEESAVGERLKRKHGHRLMALVAELDAHMQVLGFDPLPRDIRRTFELISTTDKNGESFRYTGTLAKDQDFIDFGRLAYALKSAYQLCSAASDMLSVYEDGQLDMLAHQQALEAEYAADLRAEFEDYY